MENFTQTSLFESASNDFIIRTGEELKKFHTERFELKPRDFVDRVVDMCVNPTGTRKVIGITCIRGTGKTVGMFHVIDRLNDYDNTIFIEIRRPGVKMDELVNLMKYLRYKYFFIDEVSYIEDFVRESKILDMWVHSGMNIIVSGTDSYAIMASSASGLFHRINFIRTSHITFEEQNRITGISIEDYIRFGGVLSEDIQNEETADGLASTLILDNLVNSIIVDII